MGAKQIAAFSDEDIRSIVSAGKVTSSEDAEFITKTLIDRRNLITQYWFSAVPPLDDFKVEAGKLIFKDLSVTKGAARSYIISLLNEKNKSIKTWTVSEPQIAVEANQVLEIRTAEKSSYVRVAVNADSVLSIRHQD